MVAEFRIRLCCIEGVLSFSAVSSRKAIKYIFMRVSLRI